MQKKTISIVIPAYNEQGNIPELVKQLHNIILDNKNYNFEIITVENASSDNTYALLKKYRKKYSWLKILQLSRNVGCDGAIIAGLNYAKGNAAIIMMADLQESPRLIPDFIKKWEENYDVVYGIVKSRGRIKMYKIIGTTVYYKLISMLTNNLVLENVSDFRLIDRKVYKLVAAMPEHNKFFRGLVAWTGFKQTGIPIKRENRFAGESKAGIKTLMSVAVNGIVGFSYFPLRINWVLTFFLFLSCIIFFLTKYYLLSFISFLFSLLFLQISVLTEYFIRVVEESRQRPNFIVRNKVGF